MTTLWETVTGNSTLPVQAGNTFFDHLNNQQSGSITIGGDLTANVERTEFSASVDCSLSANVNTQTLTADTASGLSGDISETSLEGSICQI